MGYLLDTNVVSALRRPGLNPRAAEWASGIPLGELFISAFTVAEIERGVRRAESSDPAQGEMLRHWFEQGVVPGFAGRVLPFDFAAARVLAGWPVPEGAPMDDALIAAVAAANDLTMATRNLKHVEPLGVPLVNPWEPSA
ncbi:type II toxin-antitoxin system VapC family toxin [Gryllotalpicola koreensis]|uniref:Type II toxin-antitoxin system VapC family toxin n=1 Tax=Gryllotalpicola koreensis TaxID=993086 RepID=A0ABP7ZXZ2_9MICO